MRVVVWVMASVLGVCMPMLTSYLVHLLLGAIGYCVVEF